MFKRVLCTILAATTIAASAPTLVFAEEIEETTIETTAEEPEETPVVEESTSTETPEETPVVEETPEETPEEASEEETETEDAIVEEEPEEEEEEIESEVQVRSLNLLNSGYDTTAPVVTSLIVNGNSFNVGDTITFTAYIEETETGVSSAVIGITGTNNTYRSANLNGNGYSGSYTASITVDSSMVAGNYYVTYLNTVDANNNSANNDSYLTSENRICITINNSSTTDTTRPTVSNIAVRFTSLVAPSTQYLSFDSPDTDLSRVVINMGMGDYVNNKHKDNMSYPLTVNAEGHYEIPIEFTSDDLEGNWHLSYFALYDTSNNSTVTFPAVNFTVAQSTPQDVDTEAPVITSVVGSTDTVVIPGIATLTISGTENYASAVSVSAIVSSVGETGNDDINLNRSVAVVNNQWTATFNVSFDSTKVAGQYFVYWVRVNDGSTQSENFYTPSNSPVIYTLENELELNFNTTLSNPLLVSIINEAPDNATILINCDGTIVKSEIFSAIMGTNKTLAFDMDGIIWYFNGSSITSPKTIDITTRIYNSYDLTDLGYDSSAKGVILEFASNGTLPGEAKIRIKSDYITNKFSLTESLYLACIKSTVEEQEEITVYDITWPDYMYDGPIQYDWHFAYDDNGIPTTIVWDYYDYNGNEADWIVDGQLQDAHLELSVDDFESLQPEIIERTIINTYERDSLVQIEESNITLGSDGYVTVTMTHNSSYVLSNKLPHTASYSKLNRNTTSTTIVSNNTVAAPSYSGGGGGGYVPPRKVENTTSTTSTNNVAIVVNPDGTITTVSKEEVIVASFNEDSIANIPEDAIVIANFTETVPAVAVSSNNIVLALSEGHDYQVQYSTDPTFKNAESVYAIDGQDANLDQLDDGTTYYIRIRTYNASASKKNRYGSWETFFLSTPVEEKEITEEDPITY